MAPTPEESDHTSIKERITQSLNLAESIANITQAHELNAFDITLKPLLDFEGNVTQKQQFGILFSLTDYLELVDHTGRILRDDKRGAIAMHLPPILQRLNLNNKTWLNNVTQFEAIYHTRFAKKRKRPKNAA